MAACLTGCQWLLGGEGSECAAAGDCLDDQICEQSRCVAAPPRIDMQRPDLAMDRGAEDAGDAGIDLGLAIPDQRVDMSDATPEDAAVPAEVAPVFPEGECFDGSGVVELARGDTLIPRGLCTPYGVLFTRSGARPELVLSRTVPVTEARVEPIAPDARLTTADGRFVAWRAPTELGVETPRLIDLAAREPAAIELRPIAVSEVVRGAATTAYVHDGKVFLHPDADGFSGFFDCGIPDRVQWGIALAGDQVGFFEQPAQGGPAQLVLADLETCRNRILHPTHGAVDRGDRLLRAGARWVWRATDATGATVRGLAPDSRGRLRPLEVRLEHAPLELAAHGDWLVGIGYAQGAYRIDAFNLAQTRYRALSEGASNHRRPHVWNGQLSWAAMVRQRWGVQYVSLDR